MYATCGDEEGESDEDTPPRPDTFHLYFDEALLHSTLLLILSDPDCIDLL